MPAARAYRAWRAPREPVTTKVATETAEARTLTLPGVDMLPTSAPPPAASPDVPPSVDENTVHGEPSVQHVGSRLMLGMLHAFGLYDVVRELAATGLPWEPVRVGLDAMVATFAVGEHTLEGARRLRALADDLSTDLRAIAFHLAMVRRYRAADRASASGERGVVYVRPLFRIDVPSHGSLTDGSCPSWSACGSSSARTTACFSPSTAAARSRRRWPRCARGAASS